METPLANYTGHGWQGSKYKRDLGIKDIAKLIRVELKNRFKDCKFSVNIQRYSGGQSLSIHLMSAPFDVFTNTGIESYQVNHYAFYDTYEDYLKKCNRDSYYKIPTLTRKAWEVMNATAAIALSYNYDDSDSMIDYFNTNFYLHLEIAKWDKPFIKKEA